MDEKVFYVEFDRKVYFVFVLDEEVGEVRYGLLGL